MNDFGVEVGKDRRRRTVSYALLIGFALAVAALMALLAWVLSQ